MIHGFLLAFMTESMHDVQSKQDLTVCIEGKWYRRPQKNLTICVHNEAATAASWLGQSDLAIATFNDCV